MPEKVRPEKKVHGKRTLDKLSELGRLVLDDIARAQPPKLRIPSRSTSNIIYDEKNRYFVLGPKYGVRTAASMKQVKKFAQLLCTADFAKELVEAGKFATLREMYYTAEGWETGPFRDQGESDLMVEDLEAMFGLKREDMGLVPEEDGAAVYGQITLKEEDAVIDATKAGRGGYTIPPTIDDVEFLKCKAKRVIAIETMGMYHRFVQEQAWKKFDALIVGLKGQAARATRRFLKRANEELGLPVYIFCLDGDETVLIEKDGMIECAKIRDIVQHWDGTATVKALSVSKEGKVSLNPIVGVMEHPVKGDMYEIVLEGGYSTKVTGEHSLMVFDRHELKPKLAGELKKGDLVAACSNVPNCPRYITKINLPELIMKECPELAESVFVILNDKEGARALKETAGRIPPSAKLRWGKSELQFPVELDITPELCRLLGYYAAEGSIDKGGCCISFNSNEKEYIQDVINCVEKSWGCDAHVYNPHPSEAQIKFGGIFLAKIFERAFKVGREAGSKRVPPIIFNLPQELKIEYLRGYFRGNGRLDKKKNSFISLWSKTVSRELASGLIFLISQLGGVASIQHPTVKEGGRQYVINISNRATLKILNPIVVDLGGRSVEISKKASFIGRFPTSVLAPLRPVLRCLFRGTLGDRCPPASWKDKRLSYDRVLRLVSSQNLTKTSKLVKAISSLGQKNFTSQEVIERVNSMFNPKVDPASIRSVLNHLRRYNFVKRVGREKELNIYSQTEKFAELAEGIKAVEFIRSLVENRISLLPIKEIRKEPVDTKVYDIEVMNDHTFVGGLGPIVQHNCDGDPFGFHIGMVVISGSAKLAYINHELAVPDAKYIGVTASDIVKYDLPTDKLRELDIARLKQLQKDPRYNTEFWQSEIKKMLELGKKAEQQAFAKYGLAYVVKEYLPAKLKEVEGESFLGKV
jgi:DNA topoisomerase VI subunit A/intein/homing endonuclease